MKRASDGGRKPAGAGSLRGRGPLVRVPKPAPVRPSEELEAADPTDPFHRLRRMMGGVILLERTDRPYESVEELQRSFEFIDEELEPLEQTQRRFLLVDTRRTTGRNDAQFERAMAPLRRQLQSRFERVAVVLRSQIGRMQVERYARTDGGVQLRAFDDFDEAVNWLRGLTSRRRMAGE